MTKPNTVTTTRAPRPAPFADSVRIAAYKLGVCEGVEIGRAAFMAVNEHLETAFALNAAGAELRRLLETLSNLVVMAQAAPPAQRAAVLHGGLNATARGANGAEQWHDEIAAVASRFHQLYALHAPALDRAGYTVVSPETHAKIVGWANDYLRGLIDLRGGDCSELEQAVYGACDTAALAHVVTVKIGAGRSEDADYIRSWFKAQGWQPGQRTARLARALIAHVTTRAETPAATGPELALARRFAGGEGAALKYIGKALQGAGEKITPKVLG